MDSLIQSLKRGKESCHQVINMWPKLLGSLDHHHHRQLHDDLQRDQISYLKIFDDHLKVVQTTLNHSLEEAINMRRAKVGRTDMMDGSSNQFVEVEGKFGGETPMHVTPSKDRRGCYKRRRNEQARVIETMNLTDDGHAWRKYGQKPILNSTHPRNYYRCTHKYDEGCKATKQVQQISEYSPKHRIIYHGHHTCKASKTPYNNPTILLDSIDDNNQNSSILLSFNTAASQPLNNYPFMFSPPTQSSSSTPSSSSSSGVALLAGSSFKEEATACEQLSALGGTRSNQYTSSPSPPGQYVGAPSADVTAVSGNLLADVVSSTERYSYDPKVHGVVIDECYSNILVDDLINLAL